MGIERRMQEHDVRTLVLAQLEMLYNPPQPIGSPTYQATLELYAKDLAGFTTDQYERGMTEFRKTWRSTRWPKIGELRGYFEQQRKDDLARLPKPAGAIPHWKQSRPEPTEEERARVAEKLRKLKAEIGVG
ncbi:MAG: hypothetical protein ACR2PW_04725 [Gammaproteobacteria bacterium]